MDSGAESQKFDSKDDKKRSRFHLSIYARILTVIISISLVIILFGISVGAILLNRSVSKTMEDDLIVSIDIADQYLTNEIELLKMKAADAADEINTLYASGRKDGVLESVCEKHPQYEGFYVFNKISIFDSYGEYQISAELNKELFMQKARAGKGGLTNTMHTLDGSTVFFVSAKINDELVLAAVLNGLYFSDLLSQFRFWETGHLFINDSEGFVVANIRPHWVMDRNNFLEMGRIDNSYEGLAVMTKRAIAGERGIGRYSIADVPRMAAFRPISSADVQWFVAIVAPISESALGGIPRGITLMILVTFLLSIGAAILGASFLKSPYEEVDRLREEAEAVSSSKTSFLANMSHEIRTPMNSIVGFSELAMDEDTSPKTKDFLIKIKTNAEWLLQIINDILDISKVESGKMELENIPFDLHELFASCRTLIMPKAAEKGITLYFYVEPSIGKRPLGDPTRLRQVLVNLLSNAIKFTNTGMVKLNASLKEMREKCITMYFEIKDSGIGMTKEQIDIIFDPFTQAESGTTRKYGGTGLGLAITKNIVEMMGGTLSAESTPGIGSKFSFELTFDTINVSDDDILEKKIVLNDIEKPLFKGEVLLCEDNLMNQQVICEHLSRVGLKTVIADNGKIGLDMVVSRIRKGEKLFDLIFMDMHMPVMDGLEASSKIFQLNAGIPIVAMTANIMANDMEIYKKSGMHDCVGKPFTSQELWRCLMKYLTPLNMPDSKKEVQLESDLSFQKSIKRIFLKDNRNIYREIIDAINNNEIQLAHRLAHSLKSNAGHIGKILLQNAASDVENQLKNGENNTTEEMLKMLEAELSMVLNELSSQFLDEEIETESENEKNKEIEISDNQREIIKKLELLLKGGNPECVTLAKNLQEINGFQEFYRLIEEFDFDNALVELSELKKGLVNL